MARRTLKVLGDKWPSLFTEMGEVIAAAPENERVSVAVGVATDVVEGALSGSVTLVEGDHYRTIGATDDLAVRGDQLQYDLGRGPCLNATSSGGLVSSDRISEDITWQRFGPEVASQMGIHSVLSYRLTPPTDQVLASLNLYAGAPEAFDQEDRIVGILAAVHVGQTLAVTFANERVQQLERTLASSRVIGMAMGILSHQHEVGPADRV